MRISRKKKPAPKLMLTSLLDMFTIILIFLIVSFDAEKKEFTLHDDVALPEAEDGVAIKPAANLIITPEAVIMNGESVVNLTEMMIQESDFDEDGNITALAEGLGLIAEVLKIDRERAVEKGEEPPEEGVVMLQAHKDLPYRTIYEVMKTAQNSDFDKCCNLVVIKK